MEPHALDASDLSALRSRAGAGASSADRPARALVTGAGSGIGRALALALAEQGYDVWICGRRIEPLFEVAREHPRIHSRACDLTDHAQRTQLVHELGERAGGLELLVNNAGVQYPSRIDPTLDVPLVEQEVAANLTSPILLTAALTPLLARGVRPLVVNISSALALAPKASAPVYSATKAALSHFSLALSFQYEAQGIDVMDVIAPLVDTPMTHGRGQRKMSPEAFAAAVVGALGRRPARLYVGRSRLLGWLLRLAPGFARRLLRAS
jgi:uncharacterized oxidoreductase